MIAIIVDCILILNRFPSNGLDLLLLGLVLLIRQIQKSVLLNVDPNIIKIGFTVDNIIFRFMRLFLINKFDFFLITNFDHKNVL